MDSQTPHMLARNSGFAHLPLHRYYDPVTGQFLNLDPLVAATGQPYAYAADDPVNEGDPSGLDSVYVLIHQGTDVPYYVGRSIYTPAVQREQAHRRSGRMGPNDQMITLDTQNLSTFAAREVEEYTMGRLGTMAGPCSFPMNQRHEISPANGSYYAEMTAAVNVMSDGGDPGSGEAFQQLNDLKTSLDIAASRDDALVPQYLRSQLWSPLGPNTMQQILGGTTPPPNPIDEG